MLLSHRPVGAIGGHAGATKVAAQARHQRRRELRDAPQRRPLPHAVPQL